MWQDARSRARCPWPRLRMMRRSVLPHALVPADPQVRPGASGGLSYAPPLNLLSGSGDLMLQTVRKRMAA
jgi:hypothetical protein